MLCNLFGGCWGWRRSLAGSEGKGVGVLNDICETDVAVPLFRDDELVFTSELVIALWSVGQNHYVSSGSYATALFQVSECGRHIIFAII